jgi:hypothetical protein
VIASVSADAHHGRPGVLGDVDDGTRVRIEQASSESGGFAAADAFWISELSLINRNKILSLQPSSTTM